MEVNLKLVETPLLPTNIHKIMLIILLLNEEDEMITPRQAIY